MTHLDAFLARLNHEGTLADHARLKALEDPLPVPGGDAAAIVPTRIGKLRDEWRESDESAQALLQKAIAETAASVPGPTAMPGKRR